MTPIARRNATLLTISFVISLFINGGFYFSKNNLYENLRRNGTTTQVYSKFLGRKGTPWYYGKPASDFFFVSDRGDTVRGREPALTAGRFSTENYLPTKKAVYLPNDPNKFMFLDDFELYSDTFNKAMYFGAGVPTIMFAFAALLLVISKLVRKFKPTGTMNANRFGQLSD